jgi:hypothetical protein
MAQGPEAPKNRKLPNPWASTERACRGDVKPLQQKLKEPRLSPQGSTQLRDGF